MSVASPVRTSRPLAVDSRSAVSLARRPWRLACEDGIEIRVRGAVPADLPYVARTHGRCSADTLLQRYLVGGRPPSLATVSTMLSEPLVLVAQAPDGEVVAFATALTSPMRAGAEPVPARALSFGLLVEDAWQRRGIGRALAGHLGASAHLDRAAAAPRARRRRSHPRFAQRVRLAPAHAPRHVIAVRPRLTAGRARQLTPGVLRLRPPQPLRPASRELPCVSRPAGTAPPRSQLSRVRSRLRPST